MAPDLIDSKNSFSRSESRESKRNYVYTFGKQTPQCDAYFLIISPYPSRKIVQFLPWYETLFRLVENHEVDNHIGHRMTLKYWEILWNLFSLSNEAIAMTSNQFKLLWKRRNCRQHEINFISIWYFLLKSFNWTRMLLIYELVRCIVIGSYFFCIRRSLPRKRKIKTV